MTDAGEDKAGGKLCEGGGQVRGESRLGEGGGLCGVTAAEKGGGDQVGGQLPWVG